MGYHLLKESDAEENRVQTAPRKYIPYNHLVILATASIAVNLFFLFAISFSNVYLPSLSRHTSGFSMSSPLGECEIGFSDDYIIKQELTWYPVPRDTYMVMDNDTSFTVLDEDFHPIRHFDLTSRETRHALYFECQFINPHVYLHLANSSSSCICCN
jgi:hypothetical protein